MSDDMMIEIRETKGRSLNLGHGSLGVRYNFVIPGLMETVTHFIQPRN